MSYIAWNANGRDLIEDHERGPIEAGDSLTCGRGQLFIDQSDNLWLDTPTMTHPMLMGSIVPGVAPVPLVEKSEVREVVTRDAGQLATTTARLASVEASLASLASNVNDLAAVTAGHFATLTAAMADLAIRTAPAVVAPIVAPVAPVIVAPVDLGSAPQSGH